MSLDQALEELRRWARKVCRGSMPFSDCYLFGSMVLRDGDYFIASGEIESDIDLILAFKNGSLDASHRYRATSALRPHVQELETTLLRTIGRARADAPIVSLVLATPYEIYHGIHKGNDPLLLYTPQFLRLNERKSTRLKFVSLTQHVESTLFVDCIECVSVIRFVQGVRNKYLSCCSNQSQVGIPDYDGTDVLPKELMRHAALLRYLRDDVSLNERTDLNRGLDYIIENVKSLSQTTELYSELWEVVFSRMTSRGSRQKVTGEKYLLLAELMYDEAKRCMPCTLREILDGIGAN